MALGVTQQLPLDDRYTYSKGYLEAQLSVLMAGRVAEKCFSNKTTTGAANDFEERQTSPGRWSASTGCPTSAP